MKLKYIGKSFIPGIPARDLTEEEVKKFGEDRLVGSGLYAVYKATTQPKETKAKGK